VASAQRDGDKDARVDDTGMANAVAAGRDAITSNQGCSALTPGRLPQGMLGVYVSVTSKGG
jgi:hypothetical protein